MTEEKVLAERALHWLPNEDLAEAQDVAAQDAAEGSWTLAVDADERDMEKAEMFGGSNAWNPRRKIYPTVYPISRTNFSRLWIA